ncbi:hypothetical protein GCM10011511_13350 [Puia dinghuensis]|uniref:Uncharacterized protein n=2 Tax=Puia dinghuensis TaxID=1792502 RepID=A0A8J2UAX4_9BACT|nr:hypothetical protein GCM10011511_13350 [Puia dinghuensis]
MNIELYMQSGIVESYALGLATPEEVDEFEQLLPHFPELKEALSDFEYHLELFSIDHEIPPPPGVRVKIEERIREMPDVRRAYRRGYYRRQHAEYVRAEVTDPYIRVHKVWRTWFIIFCIVSKIFLGLAIYYFVEYRHAQGEVLQLQRQLDKTQGASGGAGK